MGLQSDMSKVFEKYNIKARLYDVDGVMIYKYEPPNFSSKRVPTFNGLIKKNNHIYTINDNLTSLKAKSQGEKYFLISEYPTTSISVIEKHQ